MRGRIDERNATGQKVLCQIQLMKPVNINRNLVDMDELKSNRKKNDRKYKKKKTTSRKRCKGKQTNNNSSNSGRMLARTDYQAGRCRYISVWSTTMATTTSDQSGPMRIINKPFGNARYSVVDTL
jgi:hypothetical protein